MFGGVQAVLGIIGLLEVVLGPGRVVNVMRGGEKRTLDLDEMKDSAETLTRLLRLFAQMEDPRNEIEDIGKTVARLHEDVVSLIEHLAIKANRPAQAPAEEMAGQVAGDGFG